MEKLLITEKEIFDFWGNLITMTEDNPNEDELWGKQLAYIKNWLESKGIKVKE